MKRIIRHFPVIFPLLPMMHGAAESWRSHLEDQLGRAHRRSPCCPQSGAQRSTGVLFSRALLRQSVTFFITHQTHEKPVAAGDKNSVLSGKMGTIKWEIRQQKIKMRAWAPASVRKDVQRWISPGTRWTGSRAGREEVPRAQEESAVWLKHSTNG